MRIEKRLSLLENTVEDHARIWEGIKEMVIRLSEHNSILEKRTTGLEQQFQQFMVENNQQWGRLLPIVSAARAASTGSFISAVACLTAVLVLIFIKT